MKGGVVSDQTWAMVAMVARDQQALAADRVV